ncbi:MAG: fluoride efflux transporter CrcB [Acidiferrobacterales bacterium]
MIQILAIAAGGAIGSVLRYAVSTGVYSMFGRNFPYGTLAVNVAGSFLMGFLFVLMVERLDMSGMWRMAILVGFLGAFTTFSTFSIETVNLLQGGDYMRALLNITLSVAFCLVATWVGFRLGRLI